MFDDLVTELARLDRDVSDAVRVDQLTALQRVKAACAAAQARVTVDFAESQEQVAEQWRGRAKECADDGDFEGWVAARDQARRATVVADGPHSDDERTDGERTDGERTDGERTDGERTDGERTSGSGRRLRSDMGVAGQVALARRESPTRGSRHLALTLALVRHLPRTMHALEAGAVSEWRAEIIVRETAILNPEQQTAVDAELFETLGVDGEDGVGRLGDRELARRVRAIAYRIDAESAMARARGAQGDRRVTIRPAPDTMCYLTPTSRSLRGWRCTPPSRQRRPPAPAGTTAQRGR